MFGPDYEDDDVADLRLQARDARLREAQRKAGAWPYAPEPIEEKEDSEC